MYEEDFESVNEQEIQRIHQVIRNELLWSFSVEGAIRWKGVGLQWFPDGNLFQKRACSANEYLNKKFKWGKWCYGERDGKGIFCIV